MKARLVALCLAAAVAAPAPLRAQPAPKPAAALAQDAPEAVVRDAFEVTRRSLAPNARDVGSPWDAKHRDRFFSKRMAKLFADDDALAKKEDGVGRLDFDPFIDGQDGDVRDLKLAATPRGADQAEVVATFRSFKTPRRLVFAMRRDSGAWRIDDISAAHKGSNWRLSDILLGKE